VAAVRSPGGSLASATNTKAIYSYGHAAFLRLRSRWLSPSCASRLGRRVAVFAVHRVTYHITPIRSDSHKALLKSLCGQMTLPGPVCHAAAMDSRSTFYLLGKLAQTSSDSDGKARAATCRPGADVSCWRASGCPHPRQRDLSRYVHRRLGGSLGSCRTNRSMSGASSHARCGAIHETTRRGWYVSGLSYRRCPCLLRRCQVCRRSIRRGSSME
jgi:hypothetical protein